MNKAKEDTLFDDLVLERVLAAHGLHSPVVFRHLRPRFPCLEFDVVVYALQRKRVERIVCVELKERDFDKVLHQATARAKYCHYTYAVVGEIVLTYQTPEALQGALDAGVGILHYNNSSIKVLRGARLTPPSPEQERFLGEVRGMVKLKRALEKSPELENTV